MAEYKNVEDAEGPIPVHAGFMCTPNYLTRTVLRLKFKTPFMMMMISMADMARILDSAFLDYLDKSKYKKIQYGIGHDDYPSVLWNHMDPTTEEGYRKLEEQVDSYLRVLESCKDRPIIFTCFADFKPSDPPDHQATVMMKTVDRDALSLLEIARKIYSYRSVKIFVFSRHPHVGKMIESLGENDIRFIHLNYTSFIWELPEHMQKAAIQEISDRYMEALSQEKADIIHALPLPQEFYE